MGVYYGLAMGVHGGISNGVTRSTMFVLRRTVQEARFRIKNATAVRLGVVWTANLLQRISTPGMIIPLYMQ